MRILILVLLCLPLTAWSAEPLRPEAPGHRPIRPIGDCIDPSRVRGFHVLDSRTLLVDAGRRRFRVVLSWSCNELHSHRGLAFDTRNPSGRVCGDIGDAVLPREGSGGILGRCDIGEIKPISPEEWEGELRAR
ncbi:DUF6491 family protein [Pseudomarimonas salicorniae]|uniref:DUF6491 family protein n=1 Tax=Pseudomarimonas salicorniae TaxID=2933270 RepID=A0ABT0GH27_9GAMM|nr:DUF6491 family protein [Lysobacter sp. CAU 1642]MCK7593844.1 DUF6491 family protein [Lysobacter sp. CAU 1642]